jgi:hypothetical protein
VHELGHQLEYSLPIDEWMDIQDLLRMRHKDEMVKKNEKNTLKSIYPNSFFKDNREEAAFRGKMPGTGTYSAKYYDSGNTEVMSMTLEYFSNPEKAIQLIEHDPFQAAIILRLIAPEEFYDYVSDEMNALMPGPKVKKSESEDLEFVNVDILNNYFDISENNKFSFFDTLNQNIHQNDDEDSN